MNHQPSVAAAQPLDQCPLRRAAPVAQPEVEGFCVGVFGLRSVLWPPCWRGHE